MDKMIHLLSLNVNEYTEQKGKLTYLSWSHAWEQFIRVYPEATYQILKTETGLPWFGDSEAGYMVFTKVTANNITHEMFLPVMDYKNKSMTTPTTFDINKTIMRCLTKNLAMFGLGLYIYKGEDFPEPPAKTQEEIKKEEEARIKLTERLVKQNKADMLEMNVTEAQILKRYKCTIDEMNLEKLEALALDFKITKNNQKK